MKGSHFILFLLLTGLSKNILAEVPAEYQVIVSLDGSGDFKSIQAAINSFPFSAVHLRKIFIKKGIYREKIYLEKNNIWLIGEDRGKTIITQSIARDEWRCTHNEDWGVATLNISADDITLQNITIVNNFGFEDHPQKTIACPNDSTGEKKITAQSHHMALRTMYGTRLKALNCHFKAFGGDTVSPWNVENGMFYFKDCIMEGGVDFYCPRGWAWAENCEFIVHSGSAAIWHDGSRYEDSKTILKNCKFSGFDGFSLGRYHRDAQFYLIGCRFPSNMADRNIYRVSTSNQIKWGHRVYFSGTKKEGENYNWLADNLHTAKNSPTTEMITPQWLFGNRWNPESPSQPAAYVQLAKRNLDSSYGQPLLSEVMPVSHPANDFSKTAIPYYQSEGPVWENDNVGFRLYFDVRNSKDIFGKTTSNIVLDTVGTHGDKYYHHLDPAWGMDILKVGASLGAGSLALQVKNSQGKDTLVRLGGTQVEQTTFELVKNDKSEAVFRLHYKNWKVLGRVYQLTEEISIKPGDYFYQSSVTINGLNKNERLVTGIVNFKANKYESMSHGDKNILYTHDKQADDGSYLGMAVMMDKKYDPEYGVTKNEGNGIVNSYTVSLKIRNNEPVIFRFYAAWEQTDKQFSQVNYFENLLKQDAAKWNNKK